MTDEEMAKVNGGVALITAGEIVIAYNLPGAVAGVRLPRLSRHLPRQSDAPERSEDRRGQFEDQPA
jgi:hypothetical protein